MTDPDDFRPTRIRPGGFDLPVAVHATSTPDDRHVGNPEALAQMLADARAALVRVTAERDDARAEAQRIARDGLGALKDKKAELEALAKERDALKNARDVYSNACAATAEALGPAWLTKFGSLADAIRHLDNQATRYAQSANEHAKRAREADDERGRAIDRASQVALQLDRAFEANRITREMVGPTSRTVAQPGYADLARVLDAALDQAQGGKGVERHAAPGEPFSDQQIVQLCEWMGSIQGDVFQVCKKALEACRLPAPAARRELLGVINYAAAAVIVLDRQPIPEPK